MAVTHDGTLSQKSSGSTSGSITIGSIPNGSWMVLAAQVGNTTVTLTTPSGWTVLKAAKTHGTRRTTIYGKIKDSGDTTVVVAKSGSIQLSLELDYGSGSDPVADWQVGEWGVRAAGDATGGAVQTGSGTTSVPVQLTTTEDEVGVLGIMCEATNAEDTTPAAVSGSGWTSKGAVADTPAPDTTNIEQINTAWKVQTTAGATGVPTTTYQNSQANNGGGILIGITPAPPGPGSPSGATVYIDEVEVDTDLSIWDGSEEVPAQYFCLPTQTYSIADMDDDLANDRMVYWAHRGGSLDWSEMTLRAYTNAIWWGVKVLEVSVWLTDDDVFVANHDEDLDRTTALNGNVSAYDWSELEGEPVTVPVAGGVLMRLEELLDTYGQTHVLVIEDKTYANMTAMLDLIEAHIPDATDRVIIKSTGAGSTTFPIAAHARGFKTWGYFYDGEASTQSAKMTNYDYLGLNYNASSGNWTTMLTYGKPVFAHVVPTAVDAAAAIAKGAVGLQCSKVTEIVPPVNNINL